MTKCQVTAPQRLAQLFRCMIAMRSWGMIPRGRSSKAVRISDCIDVDIRKQRCQEGCWFDVVEDSTGPVGNPVEIALSHWVTPPKHVPHIDRPSQQSSRDIDRHRILYACNENMSVSFEYRSANYVLLLMYDRG